MKTVGWPTDVRARIVYPHPTLTKKPGDIDVISPVKREQLRRMAWLYHYELNHEGDESECKCQVRGVPA